MIRASAAIRSGATARVVSSRSRRRSASRIAAAAGPSGSRPRSSARRRARSVDRGVEIQLEVGVGQHDRPDVAAGHDDAAVLGQVALALEQRGADLGHGRDRRDGRSRRPGARTSAV